MKSTTPKITMVLSSWFVGGLVYTGQPALAFDQLTDWQGSEKRLNREGFIEGKIRLRVDDNGHVEGEKWFPASPSITERYPLEIRGSLKDKHIETRLRWRGPGYSTWLDYGTWNGTLDGDSLDVHTSLKRDGREYNGEFHYRRVGAPEDPVKKTPVAPEPRPNVTAPRSTDAPKGDKVVARESPLEFRAPKGEKAWEFATSGLSIGSLAVADNGLVCAVATRRMTRVPGEIGTLYEIDGETGRQRGGTLSLTLQLEIRGATFEDARKKAEDLLVNETNCTPRFGVPIPGNRLLIVGQNKTINEGTPSTMLYCLDHSRRSVLWKRELTNLEVTRQPLVGKDGTIYLLAGRFAREYIIGGTNVLSFGLHAINPDTGADRWGTDQSTEIRDMLLSDNVLYCSTAGHSSQVPSSLEALYTTDGKPVFPSPRKGVTNGGLVHGGGAICVFDGTHLDSIDDHSGSVRWRLYAAKGETEVMRHSDAKSLPDGETVCVVDNNAVVYGVDAGAGTVRWKYELGRGRKQHQFGTPPLRGADGTVYIGGPDGHVVALNGKTGAEIWNLRLADLQITSLILSPSGRLFAGTGEADDKPGDGRVFAIK